MTLGKSSIQIGNHRGPVCQLLLGQLILNCVYLKMEENVKSNNNNNPSQIKIPPGFGKISDGLDREKVDTFAYQEQSKVQKLVLKANNFLSF